MNIDEELQAALEVDPSPEFVARVRMRVAEEPVPRSEWSAWSALWLVPVAAAAVVAVAVFVPRGASVPVTDVLASRALPSLSTPSVASTFELPADTAAASPPAAQGVQHVDSILIDRREASGIRRLIAGPVLIDKPFIATELSDIEIVPIAIEPLPIGSEGVRQ